MRYVIVIVFALLSSPAMAWETRVENGACILEHSAPTVDLEMTFDPAQPLYTITLSRTEAWDAGPVFAMQFDGPRGLTISTTRHTLDAEGRRLSVSDTGFGNVLDGLEFNTVAAALIGTDQITLDLDGAAPAVAAFRRCTTAAIA